MLNGLVIDAQLYFLLFARVFALVSVAPLFSSQGIPGIARVGLSLLCAALVFPQMNAVGYAIPQSGLMYALLAIGEAMIGIITGFMLSIVYAAFQTAGQLFSLQMGFGASQVFDPLAQVSMPLMGQFLNLVAMFTLVMTAGFQKIFLTGVSYSFRTMRAIDLVLLREDIVANVAAGLSGLFQNALVIAFPILGTLFLVQIVMGLLAKAAPQMNLLMIGFPISIGVAFVILMVALPFIMERFDRLFALGFENLMQLFSGGEAAS